MRREDLDLSSRWCVLRTGGPRTLRLAESLSRSGVEAWTPRRTLRRPVPGAKPNLDGGRPMQELDAPILPTFVFARAAHVDAIEALERDQANAHVASPHPPFSILRYRGAVPFIADGEVAGLQQEERQEAATRQAMLDAESAEEARKIRIAALKDEHARRRATRNLERQRRRQLAGERADIAIGAEVEVDAMPAMIGRTGVLESNDGKTAMVRFGTRSWNIDAWRVSPRTSAHMGIAA